MSNFKSQCVQHYLFHNQIYWSGWRLTSITEKFILSVKIVIIKDTPVRNTVRRREDVRRRKVSTTVLTGHPLPLISVC